MCYQVWCRDAALAGPESMNEAPGEGPWPARHPSLKYPL